MALTVLIEIPGGTPELYESMNREMEIDDSNLPDGLRSHTAAKTDGGLVIFDVWESREEFDHFVEDKLVPAMKKLAGDDAPPFEPKYGELIGELKPAGTTV